MFCIVYFNLQRCGSIIRCEKKKKFCFRSSILATVGSFHADKDLTTSNDYWLPTGSMLSPHLYLVSFLSKLLYSIKVASQGKIRSPLPGTPNSSSAKLNSSMTISFLRYSKGSTKRLRSTLYTTKWPFSATVDVLLLFVSVSKVAVGNVILFLLIAAILCHFLANWISFLALTILFTLRLIGETLG
ncbi:Translocase, chloroplastic -like protein [Gossypium arboreum]|uniref:Translocase, chloroplastic-like protein n=1 Tax=Gossypium arboreum TaxID=29729 RepID=A0A0B0MV64_GOSAR|nr:Translocase, chloroplastic -like protein [Gossypium arboreum]